jgi:hypothetical protein
MSYKNDKKSVFEEIGIIKTLNDIPDSQSTSSFDSANSNSKNILPFLLELLTIVSNDKKQKREAEKEEKEKEKEKNVERGFDFKLPGNGKLLQKKKEEKPEEDPEEEPKWKTIVKKILIKFLPEFIRILKEALILGIKATFNCGSDFVMPSGANMLMNLADIDYNNLFKMDPNAGGMASFLLGDSSKDFDKFIYDTVRTPNTLNVWQGPNGPLIDLTYFSGGTQNNQIDFKVNQNYDDKNFGDFLLDFFASIELFSKEKFIATLLDFFFGLISSQTDTTVEQLINEEKTNKIIDKILNTDPCYDEIVYDDSFFSFNNEDLEEIERRARERKLGVTNIDLGCGIFEFDLNDNTPLLVGFLDDIKNNNNNAQLQERKTVQLLNSIEDIAAKNSPKNSESIKKKFNWDILLELPKILIKNSVMKPTVVGIYNLSGYITTAINTTQNTSFDFAINNRVFFEYVARESLAVLVKITFEVWLKPEIIKLIAKMVKKILKKIAEKKIKIIKSYAKAKLAASEDSGLISGVPEPQISGANNV